MYLQLFFLAAFVVYFFAQRADALATINSYSQGGFAIAVAVGMPINSYLGVREWRKWEKS